MKKRKRKSTYSELLAKARRTGSVADWNRVLASMGQKALEPGYRTSKENAAAKSRRKET
jgi:hypothetical protein